MKSKSKKSFATKLDIGKQLKSYLEDMPDYVAPIKMAGLPSLIKTIEATDKIMISIKEVELDSSKNIANRQNLYSGKDNSLKTRLALINTFVVAIKGKDDVHSKRIAKLVRHIRGAGSKNKEKTEQNNKRSISQIERTFGSRWMDLGHIITILQSLGKAYAPPNPDITIASLKILHEEMSVSNMLNAETKSAHKTVIDKRKELFSTLNDQLYLIKKFVKAQYGIRSTNYRKIRSLY